MRAKRAENLVIMLCFLIILSVNTMCERSEAKIVEIRHYFHVFVVKIIIGERSEPKFFGKMSLFYQYFVGKSCLFCRYRASFVPTKPECTDKISKIHYWGGGDCPAPPLVTLRRSERAKKYNGLYKMSHSVAIFSPIQSVSKKR